MDLFILLVLSQAMTIGEHIIQVTFILLYNRLIKKAYKTFKNMKNYYRLTKKVWQSFGKGKKDQKRYRGLYSSYQEVIVLKSLTLSVQ